jgi:hypothetical protein
MTTIVSNFHAVALSKNSVLKTNSPQQKMLRAESLAKKVKWIQIDLSRNVLVIDLNGPAAAADDQDRIAAVAVADSAVAAAEVVAVVAEAAVAVGAVAVVAEAAVVDAAAAAIVANLDRSRSGHSYSRLALLTEYE